jgi:hypothetical protein
MHGQMDSFPSSMLKQSPSQKAVYLHNSIFLTTTTNLTVSINIRASACAILSHGLHSSVVWRCALLLNQAIQATAAVHQEENAGPEGQ